MPVVNLLVIADLGYTATLSFQIAFALVQVPDVIGFFVFVISPDSFLKVWFC